MQPPAVISSDDLVPHMRGVQAAERDLRDLGVVWRMIESSAAISCPEAVAPILPTLMDTRERFDDLSTRLIAQMVHEHTAELADELAAKAQGAIDVLVRNLYERTADVGFLATDEVVRSFCATAERTEPLRAAMVERLAAYQAKYTVYEDVILLSPQGEVLARLDTESPVRHSRDGLVAEALASPGYVERFRRSDLGNDTAPALLYAHRIVSGSRHVGVLVLRFRFADELHRIFSSINADNLQLALVLIDDDQCVLASNDPAHVPTGSQLARLDGTAITLSAFAGREYLAMCRASVGYQGYRGPAWRAQAMISLLTAFRPHGAEADPADAVPLDNRELVAINHNADAINRELRRVVWNGRLMAGTQGGDRARLTAVLKQVNQTGVRTRQRVGLAIQDIYRTSLARAQRQTHELARLAADILDRNLYERANDCRWWALSPVLRDGLAQPATDAHVLGRVLDDIHALYTVYSRLVVFGVDGVVRAASRSSEGDGLAGSHVPAEWLQAVTGLSDAQRYAVSGFEDTRLHDHGPTYTYLAAVRSPSDGESVVGGIAVVFNAATEFSAMLRDVLAERAGFAAFVDGQGRVLSATDAALAGSVLAGLQGQAALLDHAGTHYACARLRATGYREFKSGEDPRDAVHAVVGLRLGRSERRVSQLGDTELTSAAHRRDCQAVELAVFQVGGSRYALPTRDVMEAVSTAGLVCTPGSHGAHIGLVEVSAGDGAQLVKVICARSLFGLTYPARASDGVLLVIRSPRSPSQPLYALRVDEVLTVLDVPRDHVHALPQGFGGFAPWIDAIVDSEATTAGRIDSVLVQMLAPEQLARAALPGLLPEMADEALAAA